MPAPSNVRRFSTASRRYCTPVAMITARAGTRAPSSISIAYGLRSQLELGGALRDQHLGAELLRLGVGAPRQLLPGDARRKPEVVLDPRARPGLSARRVRFEHQHVQPFRRAVHRRREPGRSGADDDEVADVGLIDRVVEAEALGDLLVGRIAEHELAAADQHRHIGRRRRESDRAASARRARARDRRRCRDGRCGSGTP